MCLSVKKSNMQSLTSHIALKFNNVKFPFGFVVLISAKCNVNGKAEKMNLNDQVRCKNLSLF